MSHLFYIYGLSLIKSIKHGLGKPIDAYKTKRIHCFRLDIKRLKAVIRLIDSLIISESHKNLLNPLKGLYGKTGRIRDLQVSLNMSKQYKSLSPKETKAYVKWINKQIAKESKSIAKEIKRIDWTIFDVFENFFHEFRRSNLEVVHNDCVTFIDLKLDSIKKLIASENNDETLHNIRKQLKDVVYTLQIMKREGKSASKVKLKFYNTVQERLGKWNDWVNIEQNLRKLNSKETQFPELEWIATIEKDISKNLVLDCLNKF
jgi:CHAD domain-containing protein